MSYLGCQKKIRDDYSYVLKDLRWLLILSGVLLAAIVAAGFVL